MRRYCCLRGWACLGDRLQPLQNNLECIQKREYHRQLLSVSDQCIDDKHEFRLGYRCNLFIIDSILTNTADEQQTKNFTH